MWIELTSPWEENMNDWHFKKLRKYQKLERTAKRNGWNVTPLYIEVGARGYINNKWCTMSKTLGMTNKESQALRHQSSTIAQKCSFYIYLSRANKEWVVRPLLQNLVGSSNDALKRHLHATTFVAQSRNKTTLLVSSDEHPWVCGLHKS